MTLNESIVEDAALEWFRELGADRGARMPITQTELEVMIADETKRIDGNLAWSEDEDHSPAVQFRAEVTSQAGYPLFVNGRYNVFAGTLSFTLIHRSTGRVYGLDLGADHHNPTCQHVGEKHKHRWTDRFADKEAYVPGDITASAEDPVAVWREFCIEAKIVHEGVLETPPARQQELWL
jgi:hypothetical protein